VEILCFVGGALVLLIPGIWLAGALALGNNTLERWTNGSSLGLAMAVYLSSLISHLDLRAFYPAWAIVALVCLISRLRSRPPKSSTDVSAQIWMVLILLLVAVSRFAMAAPLVLPPGTLDPTFHLILAKQIQITHHAIDRWPFANIALNYPTGGNILVVVMSGLSHLPLHTTFKNLIPLLGVLTTAQIYVFAGKMTGQALPAVYSAAIYGLWAWYGSIDYFRWGGLPNELAMLLFITVLSLDGPSRRNWIAMVLCFASMVLVHHHVMVVGSIILALIILWQISHRKPWRSFAAAMIAGFIIDAFFLVPYALHLANFRSTGMVVAGEPLLPLGDLPAGFGYALIIIAAIGIILSLARKIPCHPVVAIASLALVATFVIGEDIVPLGLRAMHKTAFTFFTPSRFLADLNYFLPIFAAGAIFFVQQQIRIPQWIAIIFILVASLADVQHWIEFFSLPDLPAPIIDACDWIQHNTPPDTLVDNTGAWMTYLCWREPAHIALPVSEPTADYHPASERIPLIIAGKIPPDSPGQIIVKIGDAANPKGLPILWRDAAGAAVFREWP
jgi:hypothetical protein